MTPSGPWILLRKSSRELDRPVMGAGSLFPIFTPCLRTKLRWRKTSWNPFRIPSRTWPRAERDIFELYFIEGFEPDEVAMNLPDEILAALEFSALDSKAFCRIDELAYRTGRRSKHG